MRNHWLYPKLAATNLIKNKLLYLPYLLACTGTAMMFCIILTLTRDPAILSMRSGANVRVTLTLGCIVTGIFSLIIMLYTCSVVIKQRKREFGLYSILGMEKRHIGKVIFWETFYTAVISISVASILSTVLSKLLQLILLNILRCETSFGINIDFGAMGYTALLFGIFFVFIFIRTFIIVRRTDPINLLHSDKQGEKEPKSNWLLAVLGILSLGCGYALAIMCKSGVSALTMFFVAVLFVIAGTYLLFTSFSIVLLKGLRKNKKYYYKTAHFATVSGMLYRMKRNAAGLAGICILSTMALVTISTTICLYAGSDDMVQNHYPTDIMVFCGYEDDKEEVVKEKAESLALEDGRNISNYSYYRYLEVAGQLKDSSVIFSKKSVSTVSEENVLLFWFITSDDLNRITPEQIVVEKGSAAYYCKSEDFGESASWLGIDFKLSKLENFPLSSDSENIGINFCYVVVDSFETLSKIDKAQSDVYEENCSDIRLCVNFDLDGTDEEKIAYYENFRLLVSGASNKQASAQNEYVSVYGAFFFIGIFLGILFLFMTVLIIYYKQISEGYDDHDKFAIMQKVGMTKSEVRATIRSQIMTVFFLPIVTALVHIVFAFPMIWHILSMFALTNTMLFALCVLGTFAVFTVFYVLVYTLTAKSYYRIVGNSTSK